MLPATSSTHHYGQVVTYAETFQKIYTITVRETQVEYYQVGAKFRDYILRLQRAFSASA